MVQGRGIPLIVQASQHDASLNVQMSTISHDWHPLQAYLLQHPPVPSPSGNGHQGANLLMWRALTQDWQPWDVLSGSWPLNYSFRCAIQYNRGQCPCVALCTIAEAQMQQSSSSMETQIIAAAPVCLLMSHDASCSSQVYWHL